MAESSEHLKASLAQLHAQLSTTQSVDPEARQLLEAVLRDIEQALGRPAATASPAAVTEEPASLQDRLTASARHFEAEHPTLAGAVENVLNALSRLGI